MSVRRIYVADTRDVCITDGAPTTFDRCPMHGCMLDACMHSCRGGIARIERYKIAGFSSVVPRRPACRPKIR